MSLLVACFSSSLFLAVVVSDNHWFCVSQSFDKVSRSWRFFGMEYVNMMFVMWQGAFLGCDEEGWGFFVLFLLQVVSSTVCIFCIDISRGW